MKGIMMKLAPLAADIFLKTLRSVDVGRIVEGAIRKEGRRLRIVDETIDLAEPRASVIVVAIGKAALPMAEAAGRVLGDLLTGGIIATNERAVTVPAGFRLFTGGHPVPNEESVLAAEAAIELLRLHNQPESLVIFLISGGGSALFERPVVESITLADLQEVNRVLVGCGAVIGEMNTVRRYLSAVKGGRLAEIADHARQVTLIISDVNHDDLATVSSGPSLTGKTTRLEFERIVEQYSLLERFPAPVARLITSGRLPEMPIYDAGQQRSSHLILDNRFVLERARQLAESDYGWVTEIAADLVEEEIGLLVDAHLKRLSILSRAHPGRTVCLISGGEAICPVRGNGEGGRNQEFVLRAVLANELDEIAILSAGTDGIDGRSPAAGAVADQTTLARARTQGLDPINFLDRSDSYNFFASLGDSIKTGPTGNNVRDLRLLLTRS